MTERIAGLVGRLLLAGVAVVGAAGAAAAATHPLDPLTPDEVRAATAIMRADSRLAAASLSFIAVEDPMKADVLAWRPGQPIARRARAVANLPTGVIEVVVDLDAKRLVTAVERRGVQGPLTREEAGAVAPIALADPRFLAGLRARGVTDVSKVFCAPWSAGYYGLPAYEGKRILIAGCFDTRRTTNNVFGWPIERLYAVVDLNTRQVLDVIDNGAVPFGSSNQNFGDADITPRRDPRAPTLLAQPEGASVRIDGHQVRWGNWRFHVRVDPRVGPVISVATWQDAAAPRSVLYQGSLSEMFVPYMDPEVGWYSRTFFDAGEYGVGLSASRLIRGTDCPATAVFQEATFNTERGEPMIVPDALCIFERDRGEPLWRHGTDGRRDVELVVRMAAEVGNYDYLLDWVFDDAGEIEVRVGATGVMALKGVRAQTMADPTAADDTRYGTLVAPGLVGTSHDHHFNFRLDLDVDGPANSLRRETYERITLPAGTPRRSYYQIHRIVPETERAAQLKTGHAVEKLIIVNEGRTNGVGNAVGYELLYANHGALVIDPDTQPGLRAQFLQNDVWITPYNRSEQYAAGDYILGSREPGGLSVWTRKDRPVRNTDIVCWVNISLQHLTRAEDQPVMPTLWHSFTLRPFNFGDRNPGLDVRPEPAAARPVTPPRR